MNEKLGQVISSCLANVSSNQLMWTQIGTVRPGIGHRLDFSIIDLIPYSNTLKGISTQRTVWYFYLQHLNFFFFLASVLFISIDPQLLFFFNLFLEGL